MHSFDRRHSDRFSVTGAKVHFISRKGELLQFPLADLTHSSVRFEIAEELINGDDIEVAIDIPGFHLVTIKGKVVWNSNPLLENPAYAVVQFLPFGTDPRYNSMRTHDQIKTIIERYGVRGEKSGNP